MADIFQGPPTRDARAPGEERPSGRGTPAHEIFVSYSHRDKPIADAVVSRLEQAGIRCWIAPRDVLPGRVWGESIVDAIETTRLMVVVLSSEANESRQVIREVERAIAHDVVVIPFRIELFEPTGAMSYYLSSGHWLDAMTAPLEAHIARLVEVAGTLLGAPRPTAPSAPPPEAEPPRSPHVTARSRRTWWVAGVTATGLLAAAVVGTILLDGSHPPEVDTVALSEVTTGDCLVTPESHRADPAAFWRDFPWPATLDVVGCEHPHTAEAYHVEDGWPADDLYPGDDAIIDEWLARCEQEFSVSTGMPPYTSEFDFTGWFPLDEREWDAGDRQLGCIAFRLDGGELEGSLGARGRQAISHLHFHVLGGRQLGAIDSEVPRD